jgi:hypothetical protein
MLTSSSRYDAVIVAIDAANAADPNIIESEGQAEPAELVYGRRMSATLARMAPDASEPLRTCPRPAHQRWRLARKSYPEGRAGYLRWRRTPRSCMRDGSATSWPSWLRCCRY